MTKFNPRAELQITICQGIDLHDTQVGAHAYSAAMEPIRLSCRRRALESPLCPTLPFSRETGACRHIWRLKLCRVPLLCELLPCTAVMWRNSSKGARCPFHQAPSR